MSYVLSKKRLQYFDSIQKIIIKFNNNREQKLGVQITKWQVLVS